MTPPAPTSAKVAWSVTALGLVVTATLMATVVPWDWVPGARLSQVSATDLFSARQIERAEAYAGVQRRLGWASLALSLLVACWLGFARRGRRLSERIPGPWWSATVLVTGLVLLLGELATLPLAWVQRGRAVAAGLSTQSAGGWWTDRATQWVVSWLLTSIALVVLVGLARRAPRRWPAWLAGAGVVLTLGASFAQPLVVEPLFNRFTPMPPGQLRSDIMAMARREGVDVDQVLVADASRRTTTLNAYVSGLGSSRRVVVYDTLLQRAPRDEVELVVAHELGHARDHDVLIGTALAAGGVMVGSGLLALVLKRLRRSSADPATLPAVLALMSIATLLVAPVQNSVSRAMEARADRTSLEVTGDEKAFEDLHRRIAVASLGDPTPPPLSQLWFGSHPTVLQRVAIARALGDEDRTQ